MKRTESRALALVLALLLTLGALTGCGALLDALDALPDLTEAADTTLPPDSSAAPDGALPDENGSYTARDDVALYLWTYRRLPVNFITKQDARALGWEGGSLEPFAPGCAIGGDRFGNYEGRLPAGVSYRECDIGTVGASSRGACRLVYAEDFSAIYYTDDHYETFTLLYGEEKTT